MNGNASAEDTDYVSQAAAYRSAFVSGKCGDSRCQKLVHPRRISAGVFLPWLFFLQSCGQILKIPANYGKLIVPNQFHIQWAFSLGILYPFLANTENLIKMQIPAVLVCSYAPVLKWFGDYRGLRFLCGYFGSRTFYFCSMWAKREGRNCTWLNW